MQYTTEELARIWRSVGMLDLAKAYEELTDAKAKLAAIDALFDERFEGLKDEAEVLDAIEILLDR